MRAKIAIAVVVLAAVALAIVATGASKGGGGSYKVRAIFDNATFMIPGEEVKIAGTKVGKVDALGVTSDKKAAITFEITNPKFTDFRKDAHCTIRPESLIGERFVECAPTVPKDTGQPKAPPLDRIPDGKPGAGEHLLPVQNTSTPVDVDLIADAMRLPYRQRLSLIVNELGTGLAANGDELNTVIHRANPALGELDRVLAILASENTTLARLARDSDTTLAPLARDRARVADFVDKASQVAQATAEERGNLERNLVLLPTFLAELRRTAPRLNDLATQAVPVLRDLHAHAPAINNVIEQIGPFSSAARPATRALGRAARIGGPALVKALPLTRQIRGLAVDLRPVASNLAKLLTSLEKTGGIERVMDYLFYQTTAINGADAFGHYLRVGLLTGDVVACSAYRGSDPTVKPGGVVRALPGCTANFPSAGTASVRASAAAAGGSGSGGRHDLSLEGVAKILQADAARRRAGKPALTPQEGGKIMAAEARKAKRQGTDGSAQGTTHAGTTPPPPGTGSKSASTPSRAAKPDPTAGLLSYLLGTGEKK